MIAIAAPAGPVDPEKLEAGIAWLRELGFEPAVRDDLTAQRGYLAGDDERRAAELMHWIGDDRAEAIVCARGGYGCHRIVSLLDADRVRRAGKALVGYSDVTTLLLWQLRCAGLSGIHGPMLERDHSAATGEALAALLLGDVPPPLEGKPCVPGRREGRLVGGSLTLVAASLGTPWEIDTRGAILLFEDVAEEPYAVDRSLHQLRAAGKLDELVGVGVGQMVGCEGSRHPTPTVHEVLDEMLTPLGVPVVLDLPFGHCASHLPWPVGGRAIVDGERGLIELLESSVTSVGG
ncbi:MAG: LD-carboxypeptidase [Proteobacteria bacterium]|nr:LD-carboxypeptidase [Pseudomonadota bacterium]